MGERPLRVIGGGAVVAGIARHHHAHGVLLGAFDGEVHSGRADGEAEPQIAIHHRRGATVAHDLNRWRGVDVAALEAMDIGPHHVADAVGIDAAHIRVDQHVRGLHCIRLGHAQGHEQVLHRGAHGFRRHPHGDVFRHLESIQHTFLP